MRVSVQIAAIAGRGLRHDTAYQAWGRNLESFKAKHYHRFRAKKGSRPRRRPLR